jgi:hypothetical protein
MGNNAIKSSAGQNSAIPRNSDHITVLAETARCGRKGADGERFTGSQPISALMTMGSIDVFMLDQYPQLSKSYILSPTIILQQPIGSDWIGSTINK